jgi:molecular chaperone GrpE
VSKDYPFPDQPGSPKDAGGASKDAKAQPSPSGPNDDAAEENAATAVLEDLESLRARASERDQFLSLLQRTRADFENYQKRNQKEREQERRYFVSGLAGDLLPVIDNLERATAAAKQAGEQGPLVQGVGLVQSQFLDILKRHGVTRIEAEGKPFDPNLHQAVMQQAAPGKPPSTVVQVLEQGYTIHDRVLRPAKVAVSKPE